MTRLAIGIVLAAALVIGVRTVSVSAEPRGRHADSFQLVEATVLKAMNGSYALEDLGDATRVTYQLMVDLKIPMIGMLKRKAEKVIVDTALKELKKRAEAGLGG